MWRYSLAESFAVLPSKPPRSSGQAPSRWPAGCTVSHQRVTLAKAFLLKRGTEGASEPLRLRAEFAQTQGYPQVDQILFGSEIDSEEQVRRAALAVIGQLNQYRSPASLSQSCFSASVRGWYFEATSTFSLTRDGNLAPGIATETSGLERTYLSSIAGVRAPS